MGREGEKWTIPPAIWSLAMNWLASVYIGLLAGSLTSVLHGFLAFGAASTLLHSLWLMRWTR